MARKDPESHRQKRAKEDLEKALKRGDLELALASLENLRGAYPTGALEKVSLGFGGAVAQAHRTAQWARLHALAVRAESVPALLQAQASSQEADALRWALIWGCARSRDFRRARVLARELMPRLSANVALAGVVTGILEQEGAVSDAMMAALPKSLQRSPDVRLGHEPPMIRPGARQLPSNAEDAREAVLLAAHDLPLADAVDMIQRWLAQADPAIAKAIQATVVPVARREMLRRLQGGVPLGPAVRLLLAALPLVGRTQEQVEILVEATRIAASRLGPFPDVDRDPDGFTLLASALLPEPAFGLAGARWIVSVIGSAPVCPGRDRLLEKVLLAHPGDFALWARVCARLVDPDHEREPPSWLWQCLERACVDAGALAGGWAAIPPDDIDRLVERLTSAVPLPIGLRLVEQSWQGASPELRRHLCHLVDALSEEGFSRPTADDFDGLDLDASARRMVGRMLTRTLAGPTRGLWIRLGRELIEVEPHLLPYAIQAAGASPAERVRYLTAWLDGRVVLDEWLAALVDVARVPLHAQELRDAVFDHLLRKFAADAESLAKSLRRLEGSAPVQSVLRLAHALLAAAHRPAHGHSFEVREALALARRLVKGQPLERRRKQSKKPAQGGPERHRERRRRSPPKEQLDFGFSTSSTQVERET
jgi:hypothetical protein